MLKMKVLLFVILLVAIFNNASSRPNTKDDNEYDDVLNDDEGGQYTADDDLDDDDLDDDEEADDHPPEILSKPLTIEAVLGSSVFLPCDTKDADAVSQMWQKGDTVLYQDKIQLGDKNPRYKRYDNATLFIENIDEKDAGYYECKIATSPWTVVRHKLIVLSPPRIIKASTRTGRNELKIGDTLELICEAEGNPKPKISWSKDGSRISRSEDESESSVVTIINISKNDAGVYDCLADNNITVKPVVEHVKIVVTQPPTIKIEKMMTSDDEIHLICKVHAVPRPEVYWIKEGEVMKKTNKVNLEMHNHNNEHKVIITKLDETDFGNYTCRASNRIGHLEKHVMVTGKPLTAKYVNHQFVEDDDIMIEWKVASMSPINKYQLQYRRKEHGATWQDETPDIDEAPGYMHTVKHVLKNLETGVYEVRLRSQNKYGWSDYSHVMSLEGKNAEPYPITDIADGTQNDNGEPAPKDASAQICSSLLVTVLCLYSTFL